jgi:NAD(P)-dependent dehydrogenase (short-subunit alcohol dehydrogenase family)
MLYLGPGGAGFIGSNLTRALLTEGHTVRVLDNFLTGKRENLAGIPDVHKDRFELVEGDLRNLETVRAAVKGVNFVLHQGALPSVPRSVADPVLSNDINVAGTLNLLVAARDELKLDVFRIREALPAIKARRRSIDPDLLQAELSMLVGEEQGLPAAKLEDEFKALEEKAEDQDPLEKLKRKMGLGDSSDPKPGKGRS